MNSLELYSQTQFVKLTNGQEGLLKLINKCVKEKRPCTMDDIVLLYNDYVSEIFYVHEYDITHKANIGKQHNVIQTYKDGGYYWSYKLRGLIRQWFVSNIGILVLKSQLIVLPKILIEE